MSAILIDGKASAADLRREVAQRIRDRRFCPAPMLAAVIVGEHPPSQIYVRRKIAAAKTCGVQTRLWKFPADITQDALCREITAINAMEEIDGILVQLPLPGGLKARNSIEAIDPAKDVDGLTTHNAGLLAQGNLEGFIPCTALGCGWLLHLYLGDLRGRHAVIIGRSTLVGRPLGQLLLQKNVTPTFTHSRSRNLADITRLADILCVAIGRPASIGREWIKEGTAVLDIGINRSPAGEIIGDCDFAAMRDKAGWISPVPGGVGPMTIACLLFNTYRAARLARGLATDERRSAMGLEKWLAQG